MKIYHLRFHGFILARVVILLLLTLLCIHLECYKAVATYVGTRFVLVDPTVNIHAHQHTCIHRLFTAFNVCVEQPIELYLLASIIYLNSCGQFQVYNLAHLIVGTLIVYMRYFLLMNRIVCIEVLHYVCFQHALHIPIDCYAIESYCIAICNAKMV